ncbi:hypothetical protein ACRQ5Q_22335 [Bradyrhizobium sp. PMVTL-01]|uniref:hypothetical protein n=1 Tax=Bradyrhizobium sp. PMVTL-01 TaxID=3434999 RepID=UPI003F70BD58
MSEAKDDVRDLPVVMAEVVADALGSVTAGGVGVALDDKALLAKYGFSDMDRTFSMRDPESNQILQEQEPCYELLADGFYGQGMHGTWYQEGATIVIHTPPNEHMRPLNRAAAVNYCKWLESLPQNKVYIDIGDMSEAAQILARDPRVKDMSPSQAQRTTILVAEGLRLKREGKNARDLRAGDIGRNFAPQSGGKAPPVLNARMSDLSQLGPGMTRATSQVTGPGAGVRKAQPKGAPLGGPPPGR